MTEILAIAGVLALGIMSPGPSFVFIAQRSVALSRQDGVAASLGMALGGVAFAILALLGLHTLLTVFPWLWVGLKTAGGAYLLILAWRLWKHARQPLRLEGPTGPGARSTARSFLLGLATQLSNPKTAVVYGSVFASFLPAQLTWGFVAVLLAVVFGLELAWYCLVSLALSAAGPQTVYLRFKRWIDRSAGTALGLLGLKLWVSDLT